MSNRWAFQQRKIEIAWEIVSKRMDGLAGPSMGHGGWKSNHFEDEMPDLLTKAWEWVDDTFPEPDDEN